MPEIVITVHGRSSERFPAEQATLRIAVAKDGERRDDVMALVADAAASVRDLISDAGDAVQSWSSDTARAWSERPWNQDGKQLDPIFHARVELVAVLSDAVALARLVDDSVLVAGVEISGIEWSLTDQTRRIAVARVRREAVSDAADKAAAFADALGMGKVRPLAIADAGMLDGSGQPHSQPIGVMRAAMASDSSGMAFAPQPIEVEVIVDARFGAS